MRHLFLSPIDIQSPRWMQAFPQAQVLVSLLEVPSDLHDTLLWVFVHDQLDMTAIVQWVGAGARVVALTANEDAAQAKYLFEHGVNGYLHYLAVAPLLEQVAQVIQLGGLWLGADLMRQLVFSTASFLPSAMNPPTGFDQLSAREQMVATAVAAGKSNKEVARDLDITERTVKAHLSAVFDKLQVRDRLQLVLVISGRK